MTQTMKAPEFETEEDEARWWEANEALVLDQFQKAAEDGTLGRGTLKRRGHSPTITIRIDAGDLALAKEQAEKRGLKYQTYLKSIIHQALVKETIS